MELPKTGVPISREDFAKIEENVGVRVKSLRKHYRYKGDPNQLRNDLYIKNEALAEDYARKRSSYLGITGQELDDVLQETKLGLLRAASKYDPSKGAAFSTYAYLWMRTFFSNYLKKQKWGREYSNQEGGGEQTYPNFWDNVEDRQENDTQEYDEDLELKKEVIRYLLKYPEATLTKIASRFRISSRQAYDIVVWLNEHGITNHTIPIKPPRIYTRERADIKNNLTGLPEQEKARKIIDYLHKHPEATLRDLQFLRPKSSKGDIYDLLKILNDRGITNYLLPKERPKTRFLSEGLSDEEKVLWVVKQCASTKLWVVLAKAGRKVLKDIPKERVAEILENLKKRGITRELELPSSAEKRVARALEKQPNSTLWYLARRLHISKSAAYAAVQKLHAEGKLPREVSDRLLSKSLEGARQKGVGQAKFIFHDRKNASWRRTDKWDNTQSISKIQRTSEGNKEWNATFDAAAQKAAAELPAGPRSYVLGTIGRDWSSEMRRHLHTGGMVDVNDQNDYIQDFVIKYVLTGKLFPRPGQEVGPMPARWIVFLRTMEREARHWHGGRRRNREYVGQREGDAERFQRLAAHPESEEYDRSELDRYRSVLHYLHAHPEATPVEVSAQMRPFRVPAAEARRIMEYLHANGLVKRPPVQSRYGRPAEARLYDRLSKNPDLNIGRLAHGLRITPEEVEAALRSLINAGRLPPETWDKTHQDRRKQAKRYYKAGKPPTRRDFLGRVVRAANVTAVAGAATSIAGNAWNNMTNKNRLDEAEERLHQLEQGKQEPSKGPPKLDAKTEAAIKEDATNEATLMEDDGYTRGDIFYLTGIGKTEKEALQQALDSCKGQPHYGMHQMDSMEFGNPPWVAASIMFSAKPPLRKVPRELPKERRRQDGTGGRGVSHLRRKALRDYSPS